MMSSTKYESWTEAVTAWREHLPCTELQDGMCMHRYAYPCPVCSTQIEAIGDEMDNIQEMEGLCASCFMRKDEGTAADTPASATDDEPVDDSWVDELFGGDEKPAV